MVEMQRCAEGKCGIIHASSIMHKPKSVPVRV